MVGDGDAAGRGRSPGGATTSSGGRCSAGTPGTGSGVVRTSAGVGMMRGPRWSPKPSPVL